MAPYPDSSTPMEASSTPEVVTQAPEEDSALPGMKRGIAIGVACSVGIIMIALVAFFAYRRRKKNATKAKHTRLSPEEPVEMDTPGAFWPQEKAQHAQKVVPFEADAHVVHELDGSTVPELPGHYEGQELANKKTPRTSYYAGDEDVFGAQTQQWQDWDAALNATPQPTQEPIRNSSAYQELPPVRQTMRLSATPDMTFHTPSPHASFSVSPIAPSPLQTAHISPQNTGQTRQQRYYDQARGP